MGLPMAKQIASLVGKTTPNPCRIKERQAEMNQKLSNAERKSCYQILAALFSCPKHDFLDSLPDYLAEFSSVLPLPADVALSIWKLRLN